MITPTNPCIKFLPSSDSTQNEQHYNYFNAMNNIIEPVYCALLQHTKSTTLCKYSIIYQYFESVHIENRGSYKKFIPSGYFYYGSHILLNIHYWKKNKKHGLKLQTRSLQATFWHELGHAIDKHLSIEKYRKRKQYLEKHYKLSTEMMPQVYQCIARYKKSVMPNKHKNYISYYLSAQTTLYKHPHYCYVNINYLRCAEEAFAESMSYLLHWFMDKQENESKILTARYSIDRSVIKCLMPLLKYLLKNIDWQYIGVPLNKYYQRKAKIVQNLQKIDCMPFKKIVR